MQFIQNMNRTNTIFSNSYSNSYSNSNTKLEANIETIIGLLELSKTITNFEDMIESNLYTIQSSICKRIDYLDITNIGVLTANPVFQEITHMYHEYTLAHFEYLENFLTLEKYNQIALQLYELKESEKEHGCKRKKESDYEKIRKNIVRSFEALFQGINQYQILESVRRDLKRYKHDSEILHDNTKLKEFLEEKRSKFNVSVFPDQHINVSMPTIKPEYLCYMKKYGFPDNGVFDADRMAECLEEVAEHSESDSDSDSDSDKKKKKKSRHIHEESKEECIQESKEIEFLISEL
jgi:hypothetical protein